MNPALLEKLNDRTVRDGLTGCWLWQGARTVRGYGVHNHKLVHRISYIEFIGQPVNLVLHKLECPNKNCWNPNHLYDGTYSENLCDSHITNPRIKKTHCIRGHEMTPENTVSGRNCRQCNTIRKKKSQDKKRDISR